MNIVYYIVKGQRDQEELVVIKENINKEEYSILWRSQYPKHKWPRGISYNLFKSWTTSSRRYKVTRTTDKADVKRALFIESL